MPAWRLFGDACDRFPDLRDRLGLELPEGRGVGSLVMPADVPSLLAFLTDAGSSIIRVATRHGEGQAAAGLLRKVRECARYAEIRGFGYLEAIGIPPLVPAPEADESQQESLASL